MNAFIDTETCGLHGLPVTLQYAFDDGPIKIHEFWHESVQDSMKLILEITNCTVIGFNLAFDWFQLSKMYCILHELNIRGVDELTIEDAARLEELARDGPCLKPKAAFDLMLYARRTEYQTTMNRGDVRIRRVPIQLAAKLAKKLEETIVLDDILFARKSVRNAPRWTVHDIQGNNDFKDIVLKFKPSVALKALARHVLGRDVTAYADIEVDRAFWPGEVGYAPTAAGYKRAYKLMSNTLKKKYKKRRPWPEVIKHHIDHWRYHEGARQYAHKDIEFTRELYYHFGSPVVDDDDSVLACMVGAVRWRGYSIDLPGIRELKKEAVKVIKETPTSSGAARRWIGAAMSATEREVFKSTGKVILQNMAKAADGEDCPFGKCEHCDFTGRLPGSESAKRAKAVLDARIMKKEVELYDKLIAAERFHASFKVIGALSSRMSGTDGLNAQGIKRTTYVRSKFPFAFGGLKLWGGDFSGFEVTLADAAYNDPTLRRDLMTCEHCRDCQVEPLAQPVVAKEWLSESALKRHIEIKLKAEAKKAKKNDSYVPKTEEQIACGKLKTFACRKCGCNDRMKIHALFGVHVYPDMTYDQIKATEGTADDRYTKCKSAVFAMIYGGEGYTLMTRLGVDIETANAAYKKFCERYPGVGKARQRVVDAFCSIRQEGGLGSRVEWNEPAEYVESLLGFRRYFGLENQIVKEVFALAENPPKEWLSLKVKVKRRDREQTATGAVRSALFGTAFQVQAANMRAAANHEIQSSGAQITKAVQRRIWDVQPHGAHEWLVQPMNVHDAIYTCTHPSVESKVAEVVHETVEGFRPKVPLIEFEYKPMENWASK